ncbi:MAG: hypothetical protein D4R45_04480 [Planctomycetaceae bacterium]|nr:MAG: hypothetical protein D4R45_04480 [Planctomycetaceae bacterium]
MKKLISILFCIALFCVYASAQTVNHVSHVMPIGGTYYEWTGAAVIGGVTADTAYWEVLSNKNIPVNCHVRVELTRKGETDTYDIDLQGKIFSSGTYAALMESAANTATKELLDTTSFAGNQAALPDTYYRYYRVIVNDDNACAATDSITVSKVAFKFYER